MFWTVHLFSGIELSAGRPARQIREMGMGMFQTYLHNTRRMSLWYSANLRRHIVLLRSGLRPLLLILGSILVIRPLSGLKPEGTLYRY